MTFDLLHITATSSEPGTHIGWILAAKTQSCSAACASKSSLCHSQSHKTIDTKEELQFVLDQAGRPFTALTLTNAHMCFFYEDYAPALTIPSTTKTALHNGSQSTCDAIPTADSQRLCCCSTTGCATSA